MMEEKKQSFWRRLHAKYRVAVINENTLGELLHMHLSFMNLIVVCVLLMVFSLAVFSFVIWATPLKNYLPGFDAEIREDLVEENARVDSLLDVLAVQQAYLQSIRGVVSGEVSVDSVALVDSAAIVQKEALLQARSEVVEDFVAAYEAADRDNLHLFDQAVQNDLLSNLYRPTSGVISEHFSASSSFPGIRIRTEDNSSVSAVLNGSVISVSYSVQERWTIIIQHDADYVTICSSVSKPLCSVGSQVRAGESVALTSADMPMGFQVWKRGRAIDPETLIAF